MKTYIYINHNTNEKVIIHANDILEADKLYQKQTGKHPAKLPFVGCDIKQGIFYD